MQIRPVSPPLLVEWLANRITAGRRDSWTRVAIDGAPAARPDELADALVGRLRLRGREVVRVSASDFLRPASLRLERGQRDPDVFYEDWLDGDGLAREVLDSLAAGGSGRVLPTLWNAETDRASRADYVTIPLGGVLLLDGTLLLGRGLSYDLTVHLSLTPAALARRTPEEQSWTLPAYDRYTDEVAPERTADVVVRADDPDHPALVDRAAR